MLAGDKDGLFIEADPSGKALVAITDDESGDKFALAVEYEDLAELAAAILMAAHKAHLASRKPLSDSVETPLKYSLVTPTTLALGPTNVPDSVSLTLRFGRTALGVAIPKTMLRSLGEAMIAATANGAGH
jgi:hypothetical protein